MIRRLLVDYGEVISTPLSENTITDLAALADQPRDTFLDRYWHHRPAYDLGQSPADYWSAVLARDLATSPAVVNLLTTIDVHGWLRLNSLTLRTLLAYVRFTGAKLALLSNAPEPLARAIDHCFWSRHFDHRYYSCRLAAAKPDARQGGRCTRRGRRMPAPLHCGLAVAGPSSEGRPPRHYPGASGSRQTFATPSGHSSARRSHPDTSAAAA